MSSGSASVTPEQRKQFYALIREGQREIQGLLEGARSAGGPDAVRPKVLQVRAALEARLEALLTDEQQNQWKDMLGSPMSTADLFDFD